MRPTSASAHDRPSLIRLMTASLIASALVALVAMTGPAATATTGPNVTASASAAETVDPITVDGIVQLVDGFEASGDVTFAGAHRMRFVLWFVQSAIDRGSPELAVENLEVFKDLASDPRYVPSESARDVLLTAADELIGQLH